MTTAQYVTETPRMSDREILSLAAMAVEEAWLSGCEYQAIVQWVQEGGISLIAAFHTLKTAARKEG